MRNVVFIDCHDLGNWLGCYGYPFLDTPNIDALARSGARFTNAIAASPMCMPSRASIFTGVMPHEAGIVGQEPIDENSAFLLKHFREAGYTTILNQRAMVLNEPEVLGFEKVLASENRTLVDSAVEFLRNDASEAKKPFLLWTSFFETHRRWGADYDAAIVDRIELPAYVPVSDVARKDLATFAKQVTKLDGYVGRILHSVVEGGLEDDTVIVFTTDHGIALPRAKQTLYDSGLQCALIMKTPDIDSSGQVHDRMVAMADLLPSVMEAAGVALPETLREKSFAGLLKGETVNTPEAVFSEYNWGRRSGRWFYQPVRSMRTERYKFIVNYSRVPNFVVDGWLSRFGADYRSVESHFSKPSPAEELYDLNSDPDELNNLADDPKFSELRDELRNRLQDFLEETRDPILDGPVANKVGAEDEPQWIEDETGSYRFAEVDYLTKPIEAALTYEPVGKILARTLHWSP